MFEGAFSFFGRQKVRVSSVSYILPGRVTIGEARGTIGSESSPHRGFFLTAYEQSKYESEVSLLAQSSEMDLICVNPSSVHGPGRSTGTAKVFLDLARNRQRFFFDTTISLVDIEDCARGHLLAAEKGRPGERYILNAGGLDSRALVACIEAHSGKSIRPLYCPPAIFRRLAGASELLGSVSGRPSRLCRETFRNLEHGARYDGSKAERELGLVYKDPAACMASMVDWFKASGLV